MNDDNRLLKTIDQRIQNMAGQIYTSLPGILISYNGLFASVVPAVKKDLPDGRSLNFPVISNVPVIFPTGMSGAAGVTFPVKSGDTGALMFASQSIDGFLSGGEASDPRRHDMTDCVFVPGLFPFKIAAYNAYPNDTVLFNQGAMLRVTSNKIICNVDMEIAGDVNIAQRLKVEQGTISGGISFEEHVHDGVYRGNDTTNIPVK